MSLTNEGLNYYDGTQWVQVSGASGTPVYIGRPTKRVFVSVADYTAPFLTLETTQSYTAGEYLWGRYGLDEVWIPDEDMPVGYTWQENVSLPPDERERPFTIVKSYDENVSVFDQIHTDEWYRNSIQSYYSETNTAQITREGVGGDYGSIVKSEPIPNNWLTLTLGAFTTVHGNADIFYMGLLTDPTKINVTNENLYFSSGIFRYSDIWNNREGVRKITNGVEDFNTYASDTQPDVGRLYRSQITFSRADINSETISISGGLNGDSYNFPATANVLPITGESYFIIGGLTGGASMTANVTNPYYYTTTA